MIRVRLSLAAVATTLLLSGCFFMPSVPTGGGTSGDGQSGQGNGSTETETETSTGDDMFQGVPATFPSDIPIISGEVPMGVDVGTGWSVIVKVSNTETSFTEASDKLKAAGFEALIENSTAEGSFGAFENADYQVQVTSTESKDYGPIVSYLVVKKD